MIKFDEEKVRKDQENGLNLIPETEKIVDEICERGYSSIIFMGIGGTYLYASQMGHIFKQLSSKLPLHIENATDYLYEGNCHIDKDSVVAIASVSGETKELIQAVDKLHEVGAKVIGYVEKEGSSLYKSVDYLVHTDGAEYYFWYTVLLRFMKNAGEFQDYDGFFQSLKNMPSTIVEVQKQVDEQCREYAEKYGDEELTYLVGSGNLEDWAECYGMCIMEEMQWMRTRPIPAKHFFHGTLEVIERETPLILIKGEDSTRPTMDRVENFVHRVSNQVNVFDTKELSLPGIPEKFRGILSPMLARAMFQRLNVHLENHRKHPLEIRRYYNCLSY